MKLIAYAVVQNPSEIRPAPHTRSWMDSTPSAFAYRCLPMVNANSHGWEILCPADCDIVWNGGPERADVYVTMDPPGGDWVASHFGAGVVTFKTGYLFRTSPGFNLWVGGPVNQPKDAIAPLIGIVETDWMPSTFTMNWRMTRPGETIKFRKGEPFCSIFPLARGVVASIEPEIRDARDDADLFAAYAIWSDSRSQFNEDLEIEGSEAREHGWQKHYFRGKMPDGSAAPPSHETKIRPKPFRDLRGKPE